MPRYIEIENDLRSNLFRIAHDIHGTAANLQLEFISYIPTTDIELVLTYIRSLENYTKSLTKEFFSLIPAIERVAFHLVEHPRAALLDGDRPEIRFSRREEDKLYFRDGDGGELVFIPVKTTPSGFFGRLIGEGGGGDEMVEVWLEGWSN